MTEKYVVVLDTLCDGWTCAKNENGEPVTYATQAEAEAAIQSDFEEMNLSRVDDGEEPDEEPEEFVVPLSEYVEGRKAIWYPNDK